MYNQVSCDTTTLCKKKKEKRYHLEHHGHGLEEELQRKK